MAWEDFATVFVKLFPVRFVCFSLAIFFLLPDIDIGTRDDLMWRARGGEFRPRQDAARSWGRAGPGPQAQCGLVSYWKHFLGLFTSQRGMLPRKGGPC